MNPVFILKSVSEDVSDMKEQLDKFQIPYEVYNDYKDDEKSFGSFLDRMECFGITICLVSSGLKSHLADILSEITYIPVILVTDDTDTPRTCPQVKCSALGPTVVKMLYPYNYLFKDKLKDFLDSSASTNLQSNSFLQLKVDEVEKTQDFHYIHHANMMKDKLNGDFFFSRNRNLLFYTEDSSWIGCAELSTSRFFTKSQLGLGKNDNISFNQITRTEFNGIGSSDKEYFFVSNGEKLFILNQFGEFVYSKNIISDFKIDDIKICKENATSVMFFIRTDGKLRFLKNYPLDRLLDRNDYIDLTKSVGYYEEQASVPYARILKMEIFNNFCFCLTIANNMFIVNMAGEYISLPSLSSFSKILDVHSNGSTFLLLGLNRSNNSQLFVIDKDFHVKYSYESNKIICAAAVNPRRSEVAVASSDAIDILNYDKNVGQKFVHQAAVNKIDYSWDGNFIGFTDVNGDGFLLMDDTSW